MKRPIKSGKLQSGGFSLNVLTDDELYEIHLGTLEVLKTVGVYVESEEAREIFRIGGASVNEKNKVVTFPNYLVEECINSTPDTFYAYGRIPESDVVLEANRITFTNFGEGIMFVDPYQANIGKQRKRISRWPPGSLITWRMWKPMSGACFPMTSTIWSRPCTMQKPL